MLDALAARHGVVAVVTQPDRPAGRGKRAVATPVRQAAEARGLPVLTPERLRDVVAQLRALAPDAFAVASYGKIVPQMLLDVPRLGALNVHPSLLPLYRGATPLQSAIRDGRRETGVTIIRMDAGMDTGPVLLRERTPLGPDETYGEVHDRLAARGAALLLDALERYAAGVQTPRAQSEIAAEDGITEDDIAATLTRPLRKDDLAIDLTWSARRIVDFVRSLAPQPLARLAVAGETVKVLAARAVGPEEYVRVKGAPAAIGSPGVNYGPGPRATLAVLCPDGEIVLFERVIPPGRKAMSGAEYARIAYERARTLLQRFGP
ncbi:MAG: methionyl-tRNA formyltransferase [Candidatus Eremiobacteraeota bacterium]|nr:methionyl-tRNA formyltransferase [Candidatus Eremiobacteraeota bacterium]